MRTRGIKWRTWLASFVVISALPLPACGGKTGAWTPPARDAELDVIPDVPLPLEIECGRRDQYTSPGRPLVLQPEIRGGGQLMEEIWELGERPEGSEVSLRPELGPVTSLTPDMVGDYEVTFIVRSELGDTVSCEYIVHSVIGPPVAICPEEPVRGTVGSAIVIDGDAYDDMGAVSYRWEVVSEPDGSASTVEPNDISDPTFRGRQSGDHTLRLTVTDGDLNEDSCEVLVILGGPPEVMCPDGVIEGPTRRPISISAIAEDDRGIASVMWEILERPAESRAELRPTDRTTTRLTPDKAGRYELRFTATDEDGLSSSCTVTVNALPSGPDAICPDTVMTTPLTPVELMGDGVDDGRIVQMRWSLISKPEGSAAEAPRPSGPTTASFTPDVAGEYVIGLEVEDDDGNVSSCEFLVQAVPSEGLRIEIFWNGPPDRSCGTSMDPGCDPTDVDLHLLREGREAWFNRRSDCYYANCIGGSGLEWGGSGPEDNPSLDIDDTDGFGPENINIERPAPGTYRVGVHMFSGDSRESADVTVNIFCGEGSTRPVATFGPVTIRDRVGDNDFWKVADVTIGSGPCAVRSLETSAGPNIVPDSDARVNP